MKVAVGGTVYFIGAGPGAPDLLTLRGRDLIVQADLVLYADSLVEEEIALLATKSNTRIVASSTMHLDEIMALMVECANQGGVVARVHSGDPAIYGAVHEQMVRLEVAGVPYEIVPGVASALAAAAWLSVELTVPELVQTIILTRAPGRVEMPPGEQLRELAAHGASLVIHLSITRIRQVVEELVASGGYTPESPVAVVHKVSWPDQSYLLGTLADIAEKVRAAGYTRQALILVSPALAPGLKQSEKQGESHLYDKNYTHRFRQRIREQRDQAAAAVMQPVALPAEVERAGIAIIAVTRRGSQLAARLAAAQDADCFVPTRFQEAATSSGGKIALTPYGDSALAEVRRRWGTHRTLILVMATGIAVRAFGSLLNNKALDPSVICVDEQGRSVIPLLGGHQAGANEMAQRIAGLTGGFAAITTASEGQAKPALDLLGQAQGWRIDPASALTHASACLINDEPVAVFIDPALEGVRAQATEWIAQAENFAIVATADEVLNDDYAAALIISHRSLDELWRAAQQKSILYRPPVLVAGMGCRRGVPATELGEALSAALEAAGLSMASLVALATAEIKADEIGLVNLADQLNLPLKIVPTTELVALDPANFTPSAAQEHFQLPGVAEPCAMLAAGGPLLAQKRAFARCTVAVALTARAISAGVQAEHQDEDGAEIKRPGAIALVSLGPGDPQQMTMAAQTALRSAEVVVGYQGYIEQIRALLTPSQIVHALPIGQEIVRAQQAIELALAGKKVALVSSGDVGIYAMAGPLFEQLRAQGWNGDNPTVEVFPGISALQAAAARLGAAISHDFCAISLSDLLTPWPMIEQRVQAATSGDFVIAFYNPRSRERHWQLERALDMVRAVRSPETPVGVARNVTRADEQITLTTLGAIDVTQVDMFTLVLVGNSQSYVVGGRLATPRGYTTQVTL